MIVKLNFHIVNMIKKTMDYRLYVDNDLIIERMFEIGRFGDRDFMVDEQIVVDLAEGEHTVRIEQVNYPEEFPPNSIVFKNMRVFGIHIPEGDNQTSICFYV